MVSFVPRAFRLHDLQVGQVVEGVDRRDALVLHAAAARPKTNTPKRTRQREHTAQHTPKRTRKREHTARHRAQGEKKTHTHKFATHVESESF